MPKLAPSCIMQKVLNLILGVGKGLEETDCTKGVVKIINLLVSLPV
jgi:hypothetical protein